MNVKIAPQQGAQREAGTRPLYERDFYSWALEQARLVRERRFEALDADDVAEELESLGRSEARELQSRYRLLLAHLLKWRWQPDARSKSWRLSIRTARDEIEEHLADNPGLRPRAAELFARAYRLARNDAARETGFEPEAFPQSCPFTIEQAVDAGFRPEPGP